MAKKRDLRLGRNLDSLINSRLKASPIEVGNESFYLVEVKFPNGILDDFLETYSSELSDFQKKLAEKIFDGRVVESSYGFLLDESLRVRHVFNRRFASYDCEAKRIVYTPAEEVLVAFSGETDLVPCSPHREEPGIRPPHHGERIL